MQDATPQRLPVGIANERLVGASIGLESIGLIDAILEPHCTCLSRRTGMDGSAINDIDNAFKHVRLNASVCNDLQQSTNDTLFVGDLHHSKASSERSGILITRFRGRFTFRICNSADFRILGSGLYVVANKLVKVWRSISDILGLEKVARVDGAGMRA